MVIKIYNWYFEWDGRKYYAPSNYDAWQMLKDFALIDYGFEGVNIDEKEIKCICTSIIIPC